MALIDEHTACLSIQPPLRIGVGVVVEILLVGAGVVVEILLVGAGVVVELLLVGVGVVVGVKHGRHVDPPVGHVLTYRSTLWNPKQPALVGLVATLGRQSPATRYSE